MTLAPHSPYGKNNIQLCPWVKALHVCVGVPPQESYIVYKYGTRQT